MINKINPQKKNILFLDKFFHSLNQIKKTINKKNSNKYDPIKITNEMIGIITRELINLLKNSFIIIYFRNFF